MKTSKSTNQSTTRPAQTASLILLVLFTSTLAAAQEPGFSVHEKTTHSKHFRNVAQIEFDKEDRMLIGINLKDEDRSAIISSEENSLELEMVCKDIPPEESILITNDASLILTVTINEYGTDRNRVTAYDSVSCKKLIEKRSKTARSTYDGRKDLGVFIWSEDIRTDSPFEKKSSTVYITELSGKSFIKDRGYRFLRNYFFLDKETLYSENTASSEYLYVNTKTWKKESTTDQMRPYNLGATEDHFYMLLSRYIPDSDVFVKKWISEFKSSSNALDESFKFNFRESRRGRYCATVAGVGQTGKLAVLSVCSTHNKN